MLWHDPVSPPILRVYPAQSFVGHVIDGARGPSDSDRSGTEEVPLLLLSVR